jgi:hypothetical protein
MSTSLLGHRVFLTSLILAAVFGAATAGACGGDDDGADATPASSHITKLVISPDHGEPRQGIYLSACGLDPNAFVTIEASSHILFPSWRSSNPDDPDNEVSPDLTDASGAFNLDALVPEGNPPGTFIVRVSTSKTVFAETAFEIEQQGTGQSNPSPTAQRSPQIATC